MTERAKRSVDALRLLEVVLLARRHAGLQLALIKIEAKRRLGMIVTAIVLAVIAGCGLVLGIGLAAAAMVSGLHAAGYALTSALGIVGGVGLAGAAALIICARHLLRKSLDI